jgi:hypothetical protein
MNKKRLRVLYPWNSIKKGECFFVPAVSPPKVKQEGLTAALHLRIRAKAEFGLLGGRHGVLFTRRS